MKVRFFFLLLISALAANAGDFLASLPSQSEVISGYAARDSVEIRLSQLPLCPVEGIWQMADGGAVFAVERAEPSTELSPSNLRMVMLRSSWRTIRPGTIIGHLVPTPKRGVYEARIYTEFARRTGLDIPRRFTLELSDTDALMTFRPFKSPVKINLFKLLPYMYRRAVTLQESRPENLDGAVKIFPLNDSHPLSPVYL